MRCPKCGYHSFDYLDQCKKCGVDLAEHKAKYGLGSVAVAPVAAVEMPAVAETSEATASVDESADFGFGLMDEEPETPATVTPETEEAPLFGSDEDDFSFDAPETDEEEDIFSGESDDFSFDTPPEEPVAAAAETVTAPLSGEVEDLSSADFADDDLDSLELDDLVSFEDEIETQDKESSDPFDQPESSMPQKAPESLFEASEPLEEEAFPDDFSDSMTVRAAEDIEEETGVVAGEIADTASDLFQPEETEAVAGEMADTPSDLFPPDETVAATTGLVERSDQITDGFVTELPDLEEEPVASVSNRIIAGAIDLALLLVVGAAFVWVAEFAMGSSGVMPSADVLYDMAIPYFLVLFGLFFGYFTLFHFLSGQTIGKMLCRIRVEGLTGGALSLSQAFLRSVGGLVSALVLGVGYLLVMFDRSRRGWNDRLAGTRVVSSRATA